MVDCHDTEQLLQAECTAKYERFLDGELGDLISTTEQVQFAGDCNDKIPNPEMVVDFAEQV